MVNKNMPKVSIIIPVYNGANYLREAIDSALAQTYSNMEIIVVNDGSRDDGATEAVAKSYGNKIRYYSKENGGVATALNLALSKMKGDYFSWLSHDDLYEPNKVEAEVDYLIENNLVNAKVVLYSDFYLVDKNAKIISTQVKDHNVLGRKPAYALLTGAINGITLLIPKAAFIECGNFDADLWCTQDYDLWLKMFRKYRPIHMPLALARTRYHVARTTNTSPVMVSEGNALYINMLSALSKKEKEQLEGSEYNFYFEMAAILQQTPYDDAKEYCQKKLCELEGDYAKKEKRAPLVSVIISALEPPDDLFLDAVKSAQKQTYENKEILIVGAANLKADKSLKKLSDRNDRVRLVFADDARQSVGDLMDLGVKNARGEYVAFLDRYHKLMPEKLAKQVDYMGLTKSRISHTSHYDATLGENVPIDFLVGNIGRVMMHHRKINTCTVVAQKDLLLRDGICFGKDTGCRDHEISWLELAKRTYFGGVNEPLTRRVSEAPSSDSGAKMRELHALLQYLIADSYYTAYPNELSWVMSQYAKEVKDYYHIKDGIDGDFVGNKVTRNMRKVFYYFKHEGVRSVMKRTTKKLGIGKTRIGSGD